jgi:hypothetical protein
VGIHDVNEEKGGFESIEGHHSTLLKHCVIGIENNMPFTLKLKCI